jgi:23S rRNA pseudouridine955/2504/2580 synthase
MREIPVGPQEAGQRLDSFLKKVFPSAPLSFFYKGLRNRVVTVGKKTVQPDYRLADGDVLRCFLPDAEFAKFTARVAPPRAAAGPFKLNVLWQDAHAMAVDKPAGVNVHPGDHKTDEVSLIQRVQDHLRGTCDRPGFRPSLAHRLDRDTSGVVLVAKTPKALAALTEAFREREPAKEYLAACVGVPKGATSGGIDAPLLRIENARDEAKVRVDPAGKNAFTRWRLVSASPDGKWSLLACEPKTGLTHQIRVHLAHLGCPIVGDKSYGDRHANALARTMGAARQLLHARAVTFPHPVTGEDTRVASPVPEDFRTFLKAAGLREGK